MCERCISARSSGGFRFAMHLMPLHLELNVNHASVASQEQET